MRKSVTFSMCAMASSDNGVTQYAKASVELYFEPDHINCAHCPLLETYSRNQCRRTGEYITNTKITGMWCPLIFEEELLEKF